MTPTWPFQDAENAAVFTSKRIVDGNAWVHYVAHDADDMAWQFHPCGRPTPVEEAAVVGLRTMWMLDRSIELLADLPLGWCAWREAPDAPWIREVKPPH